MRLPVMRSSSLWQRCRGCAHNWSQKKKWTAQKNTSSEVFLLRLITQDGIASFLMQIEYYNLGFDYAERYPRLIQAVTAEDVLRVAKAYLHPENYILVAVANLKEAELDK